MIKESIKTASTIEEAKNAALLELGLTEMDLYNLEVLKVPEKKKFGLFGGSPAQVKVTVEIPDEKPVKEEKAKGERENGKKSAKTAENRAPREIKAVAPEEKRDSLKPTDEYNDTADYIKSIILGLGIEQCDIKVLADDEEIYFELECGEDYGIVIGRRGETLDAIQYLARMSANKGGAGFKRVFINVGNYREKRVAVLENLAKRTAVRAVKTGRSVALEPMNPYERRIIHTAVQEIKGATSYSTGEDLDRRVIIAPENGGKGNYGYKDRGRGSRDRRPKREAYVPEISENREKRSDYSSASLYGKVEVKKDEE